MKNKISFILYGDDDWILSENINYVNILNIPDDIVVEIIKITNRYGLVDYLEYGRKQSNAKYKVYLDQNAYIIDKDFILKILSSFKKNPQLGLLGVRGYYKDPQNGELIFLGNNMYRKYAYNSKITTLREGEHEGLITTLALDSHVMITSIDTPWSGGDINTSIAKSVELKHMGFETAVMINSKPMILFDNNLLS